VGGFRSAQGTRSVWLGDRVAKLTSYYPYVKEQGGKLSRALPAQVQWHQPVFYRMDAHVVVPTCTAITPEWTGSPVGASSTAWWNVALAVAASWPEI
jgi:hypothetical protein